jgi:hypothetical protein
MCNWSELWKKLAEMQADYHSTITSRIQRNLKHKLENYPNQNYLQY